MLMKLEGVNGQLELYNDKVIIRRKGLMSKLTQGFTKGDKTIYIRQIAGIQVKPGGYIANGYIQFTIPGGNESTKGVFNATQDENTVVFMKADNEIVNEIKVKIEELQSNPIAESATLSTADEIKKFKELLDQGIINADEFEAKKNQLLGL